MEHRIIKQAKEKGPEHFYLFAGDDYMTKELARDLINAYLKEGDQSYNLIQMEGQNLDIAELRSTALTSSLFGKERVILVERVTIFARKSDTSKFISKLINAWLANKRKTAFRALSQILTANDISAEDIADDTELASRILNVDKESDEARIVGAVAAAMLADGESIGLAQDEASLEELFNSQLPEGTVIIFTAESVDKRKKLFKKITEKGVFVELEALKERYSASLDRDFFDKRVRETLNQADKKISKQALEEMHKRSGSDIRRLNGEIQKLIRYTGDKKEIDKNDVEEVFSDFHETQFFELNRVIRTAEIEKCLPALHASLENSEHPLQALGSIANEFRRLIIARELLFTVFRDTWKPNISFNSMAPLIKEAKGSMEKRKKLGKLDPSSMKEYAIYSYMKDAQRFPLASLISIMEEILKADEEIKSAKIGSNHPEIILESLVVKVCLIAKNKGK